MTQAVGNEVATGDRATFTHFKHSTKHDWDLIIRESKGEQDLAIDNLLALLRQMGEIGTGGFPVTRLEHSLQTATRAERDGRSDEYVLCALLHDVGDMVAPFNHEAVAAAILQPFVGEDLHWMVTNHGAFQGMYFFHHLGMDRNARDRYAGSPYWDMTVEFCEKYDGAAFDPEYDSYPLEHFEPLVRRLMARSW